MKSNKGLSLVATVIIVAIMVIAVGVVLFFTLGRNGMIAKANNTELDFDKDEVLEAFKTYTMEYYLKTYEEKFGKSTGKNTLAVDDLLQNFVDSGYVKKFEDETISRDIIEEIGTGYRFYVIDVDKLNRQITEYGRGTWEDGDVFVLRRVLVREQAVDEAGNPYISEKAENNLELAYKPAKDPKGNDEIQEIGPLSVEME